MVLHSPLTVTERSEHSFDPFPDNGRVLPWGVGCAVYYTYVDLRFRNDTDTNFQIRTRVGERYLEEVIGDNRPMELDDVVRELYEGAPEDFVELRKTRAAEARSAGDRDLAKHITALRRPTRSAWIVNLLSHQAGDELGALLELGAALADAQQRLSGNDLRQLSRQRNAAISALVRRGGQLAEVRGHRPSEATMREVTDTLQAALSDPEVAAVVRQGRLAQPQSYGGFGPEMIFAPTAPRKRDDQQADQEEPPAADQAEAEHQRRLDELAAAQQALDRLDVQLNRIEEQLQRAVETADHRAERLADLRDQLERAEREASRAGAERDRLVSEQDELQSAKKSAEQRVSDALSRLADD